MKLMVLTAAALMGAAILAANAFATANNAAPTVPSTSVRPEIQRLADDGRKECDDEAVKACTDRCKGRDASCFPACRQEMFNMCYGG